MIKFYRRIRQQLLSENRFYKYLIYAIGEIVLVVIGILIALQINNWNEAGKVSREEIKVLQNVRTNLLEELSGYENWNNDFSRPMHSYLTKISEGRLEEISLGSFVNNINIYYLYVPVQSAYIGLKSSGKLSIIKNFNAQKR